MTDTIFTLEHLKKFCNPYHERMKSPFIKDDYVYATDGRVAIKIHKDHVENGELPQSSTLDDPAFSVKINSIIAESKNGKLSNFQEKEIQWLWRKCTHCRGYGWTEECQECRGSGQLDCSECGQPKECDDCDGDGRWPKRRCDDCLGIGQVLQNEQIDMGGVWIGARYLALILDKFTNAQFFINGETEALYFHADNVTGVLMPVKKPKG